MSRKKAKPLLGGLGIPTPEPDAPTGWALDPVTKKKPKPPVPVKPRLAVFIHDGVQITLRSPLSVEAEIRLANPVAGYRADFEENLKAAVRAKCLGCASRSQATIAGCTAYGCGLWAVRPYQDPENIRPPGFVPSEEEYLALHRAKTTPEASTIVQWRQKAEDK